eukprot:2191154-Prymnesium_polylepis.1
MPPDCSNLTATICTDFCRFSSDNDCDDGGPGSEYTLCNFGDDCIDCGPRPATDGARCAPTPPPPPPIDPYCTNDCGGASWHSDGDCGAHARVAHSQIAYAQGACHLAFH